MCELFHILDWYIGMVSLRSSGCLSQIPVKIILVLVIIIHLSVKVGKYCFMLLRDWWGRNSCGLVFLIVIITRTSKQLGKYYVLLLSHSVFENQAVSFSFIFLLHCFNFRVKICTWS